MVDIGDFEGGRRGLHVAFRLDSSMTMILPLVTAASTL
jgi:hypothetical protein